VGRNSFLGVNSTIVNEVEIGEYNIIGAAALISKCTKPHTVHLARSGEPFRYSAEEYTKYFGV
jgi:carbonic anhydrase/acetyltransferase-like protein (isoleucine patch superfamily)